MNTMRLSALIMSLCAVVAVPQEEADFDNYDAEPASVNYEQIFSLSARVGYGFKVGGVQYLGSRDGETRIYGTDNEIIERKDHYHNYGQGLKVEIAGNLAVMQNVEAELSLHFTGKVPRTVIEHDAPAESWKETYKQASYGAKIMLLPRFRVVELIDMHVGFGIGLFFTSLKSTNNNPQYGLYEGYIKTRPGLAFAGKIGGDYPLSDRVAITADICGEMVSYTVKERRETDDDTVYKTDYNRSSSSNNVERPNKIPGSNVAVLVGIRFAIL